MRGRPGCRHSIRLDGCRRRPPVFTSRGCGTTNSFTRKSSLSPRQGGWRASSSAIKTGQERGQPCPREVSIGKRSRGRWPYQTFTHMRESLIGSGRSGPCPFLNQAGREGGSARGVFASTRPIYNDSRQRWNNVPFVGVADGKRDEHELRAVGQLNVSGVVARFAGPAGL